ncbi:MAG: RNA polymerase sigma factor [Pseudomonadota bacterium]
MFGKKSTHDQVTEGLKAVYPRLWRYCLTLTGNADRANDLAQSTAIRAMEKSHLFKADTHVDRWLFRMAQRIWLNEVRSDAVRRGGGLVPIEDVELPDKKPGPESNLLTREVLKKVMDLPEAQRATIMLVYVEGYSYAEAAEILEIPIGTVMSRLHAGRAKLSMTMGKLDHKTG